jgi:hypothetical protein
VTHQSSVWAAQHRIDIRFSTDARLLIVER